MSSIRSISALILRADRLAAVQKHDFLGPESYGAVIIKIGTLLYELTLAEIGQKAGHFKIEPALQEVDWVEFDLESDLIFEGPFSSVDVSEIISCEDSSDELQIRLNQLIITSLEGEITIAVDLDSVGGFRIRRTVRIIAA